MSTDQSANAMAAPVPSVASGVEDQSLGAQGDLAISRRTFVQVLGAGILITACAPWSIAQQRRAGGGGGGGGGGFAGSGNVSVAARVHIGKDGLITVMTGKVEGGQGARAELTQAAAEELRVPPGRIQLIMADTGLVPDDGMTAGSRSTPSTVPAVRHGAAAARNILIQMAAQRWGVDAGTVEARDGKLLHAASGRELTCAELAGSDEDQAKAFQQSVAADVTVTPVKEWKVMGVPLARPNGRDIVTGVHHYPSDIVRPGMLYGKVLRAPSYGAKLTSVDLAPAKAMKDVVVVQDGSLVGVAAPTLFVAEQALAAIAKTAQWEQVAQPSSKEIFDYLRQHARGGVPKNPFADAAPGGGKEYRQTYHVNYIQHAPLEPRVALAEWQGDNLTVWNGTQNPFGVRKGVADALGIPEDRVRVIVPDFGAGFGGKHMPDIQIEAARMAKAIGKPVLLRWTRQEEFTWAYFRPAAVIDIEASLDAKGTLATWHFVNINAGGASIDTPYRVAKAKSDSVGSESPLRQGSYRSLAAAGNNFARESFMDELALAAGSDPLAFRLANLENPRMQAVLETAAQRFDFAAAFRKKEPGVGVGIACGTDKGSYVAACAEIAVANGKITVRRVCQVFECGAIINPEGLLSQVQGAIIMGMGGALREEMRFENGSILNASFFGYLVPRFSDVPQFDIHLLNRPDLASAGAGETPIIAIAPAIANAVFHAAGQRVRQMPIMLGNA